MTVQAIGQWTLLHPWWLALCTVLVCLAIRWHKTGYTDDWSRVMSRPVLRYLRDTPQGSVQWNLPLWCGAIACLALAAPASRQSEDNSWRHSSAWIAVVDVSRSMTVEDIAPYRLGAVRPALTRLSRESGARSIAMVIFAGDTFLVTPPAFDKTYFNNHAAMLAHGMIPTEGSNLSRALSLTATILEEAALVSSRVFVFSDSGGISDSAIAAAQLLSQRGHRLDYLLFGTQTPQKDSAQNPEVMANMADAQALASAGGGIVAKASRLGVIDYDRLDLKESSQAQLDSELQPLIWKNQSHWILLMIIPLLLLQFKRDRQT